MKKLLVLLLLLTVLAACAAPVAAPGSSSPTSTTTIPAQTEPAPDTDPAAPPPEENPTEPVGPAYAASGSRTAGGVLVHTDPAAYSPRRAQEPVCTRLREGPLEDFEPSPDYGAVYPYVVARLYRAEESGYTWQSGALYGLVDASGRILTDGIYPQIGPLRWINYETGDQGLLGFWLVTKVENPGIETYTDGDETYSWAVGDVRYGLISLDGSFALPCVYDDIEAMEESFLCRRRDSDPEFEVYDAAGQLRFTSEDLRAGENVTVTSVEYGEDLYCVRFRKEEKSLLWYCDKAGSRVLGPFTYGEPFSEGLACVSVNGRSFGFIDKGGNWVIDPVYSTCEPFSRGRTLVSLGYDENQVIDREGRVLLRGGTDCWIYRTACGFDLYDGNTWINRFYDLDGRLLYQGGQNAVCLDADTFCDLTGDGQRRVFRLTGEEQILSERGSLYRGAALVGGEAVMGYVRTDYEGNETVLLPFDLSQVLIPDAVTGSPLSYGSTMSTNDQITGETWYLCWDGRAWRCVSETGQTMTIPLRAVSVYFRGERICCLTDSACVYLDRAGNTVFSYPLHEED